MRSLALALVLHSFQARGMGNKRFDTIFDFARHGFLVEITCACGHRAMLEPYPIIEQFMRERWPTNSLATARDHLRCSACGERPERIGPAMR